MGCLGFEPGAAGWKAQTDPRSYGGTPSTYLCLNLFSSKATLNYMTLLS